MHCLEEFELSDDSKGLFERSVVKGIRYCPDRMLLNFLVTSVANVLYHAGNEAVSDAGFDMF